MTCERLAWGALGVVVSLASGISSHGQAAPAPIDPAVASLARRIGESLQKKKVKAVFVADLRGPDGQEHPVGKWLADLLSSSLEKDFSDLQMIGRPTKNAIVGEPEDESNPLEFENERKLAKKLGAKVVVTGSFARVSGGIAISLYAVPVSDSSRPFGNTDGVVPISDEIAALSPDPIPSPKGGISRAGTGGISVPQCIYCPPPDYSKEARKAKLQGTVTLLVTVTTDGHATNMSVTKDPGMGLAEKAIEAVTRWRFKPAVGPNGQPVPVIVPIEITFRY